MSDPDHSPALRRFEPVSVAGVETMTTEQLFAGKDEIVLLHNGASYRLRITRQNKLILTK